jgi:uncharacterized protein (DUF697 family)
MHSATLSTGTMALAPLANAVAMVLVALNTSMITTMLLLTSNRFNNAGESVVYSAGLMVVLMYDNCKKNIGQ